MASTLIQRMRAYVAASDLTGNGNSQICSDVKEASDRLAKLEAAIVGINIALARDENLDAGAKLAIDVRKELQF